MRRRIGKLISELVMLALLLMLAPIGEAEAAPPILVLLYAVPGGLYSGACDSWAAACELSYALSIATGYPTYSYRLSVQEGTYTPTNNGDRSISFSMRDGVRIWGGYSSADHTRDAAAHTTILSGDLNGDDGPDFANNGENSYHVVTAYGVGSTAILDGFTITGGNADGSSGNANGGGLWNSSASGGSNPTLTHLTFTGNSAMGGSGFGSGGGLYNYYNNYPTMTDIVFSGNQAGNGGGLWTYAGLTLTRAIFSGNQATKGGGVYNLQYAPTLTDVLFYDNHADYGGGWFSTNTARYPSLANVTFESNTAAHDGGGMYHEDSSRSTLTNVTFHNNSAERGGALANLGGGSLGPASVTLKNVILWGDTAATSENEVYNDSPPTGGTATIDDSIMEGGCSPGSTCNNLLTTDPKLGALADNGGFSETMALLAGSSAIDAGDDAACTAAPVNDLDQRGFSRPKGPQCDIGAFERIPPFSDFDHDAASEPVKFIPSTGWAWWLKSSNAAWAGQAMGGDVDSYVSRSDFDGDGKTDPAKYVSSGQSLWYFGSADSSMHGVYMGSGSYTMLPGSDFDGDQMTDPAKYLAAAGAVWRLPSTTGVWEGTYVGTDAAPALPGCDYDGDGKTDLAKYVPSAGAIWFYGSSDNTWHGTYIGSDGTPVPASDFDGDGKTDMAKYLTSSNSLWWRSSLLGTWTGTYLGPGSFTYVPASDFDGDGKTDAAKFDSNGKALWYLPSSSGSWVGVYMGGEAYSIAN